MEFCSFLQLRPFLKGQAQELPNKPIVYSFISSGQAREPFQRCGQHRWGAQCEVRKKMAVKSPLGRGKGRQALGWVAASKQRPTPSGCATAVAARPLSLHDRCRCASHPSREGIFLGALSRRSSLFL